MGKRARCNNKSPLVRLYPFQLRLVCGDHDRSARPSVAVESDGLNRATDQGFNSNSTLGKSDPQLIL